MNAAERQHLHATAVGVVCESLREDGPDLDVLRVLVEPVPVGDLPTLVALVALLGAELAPPTAGERLRWIGLAVAGGLDG